ncbi:MAG: PadR family transcriptional regulator [Tissierella sp.]|nr:PadR family transcriptional regulator [Tissierella sp.]
MAKKALTQPMYYILLSLKEKRHGYEIMQFIEWLTEGRVKVGPGTLYSLLSRFEDDRYIDMVSDDDNKKTYIITDIGKEILDEEIERLSQLLEDARYVKGGNEDEFQNRK